ncbi:hypothetical protein COU91_01840 [Candidatus Saccharibacteria bacterium CG10_big_fil_rev_8_21_14_0_10_47_8]|nr:MAG: hypothetical protein COU91_01840 [Candidatus Saccharibacteria bacterium CG10_big_fil_rev_8_21_14_0_10_47_8]
MLISLIVFLVVFLLWPSVRPISTDSNCDNNPYVNCAPKYNLSKPAKLAGGYTFLIEAYKAGSFSAIHDEYTDGYILEGEGALLDEQSLYFKPWQALGGSAIISVIIVLVAYQYQKTHGRAKLKLKRSI